MSDWQDLQRVGSSYYRTKDVYAFPSSLGRSEVVDIKSLLKPSNVIAVCPCGGPVAVIEKRGKNRLVFFTPSYRIIAEIDLTLMAPIIGAFWSDPLTEEEPVLKILTSDWKIRTVCVRPQHMFMPGSSQEIFPRQNSLILAASVLNSTLALLSESMEFFVFKNNTLFSLCNPSQLHSPVVSFALLPSDQVLCALEGGARLVLSQQEEAVVLRESDNETVIMMSVSLSSNFVALYSSGGSIEIFATPDLNRPTHISHIDIGIAPSQLAWVGDDCLCVAFCSGTRNVLFLGGDESCWSPFEHENFFHLSSDLACCSVLSPSRFQIIQRVPELKTPEAQLLAGFEKFTANDVGAESIIRSIKDQLFSAVKGCAEAAAFETPISEKSISSVEAKIKNLLQAASFGRQFIPSPVAAGGVWVNAAALIRLCSAMNKAGIPIGVAQLMSVGTKKIGAFLTNLLAARGEYLLAIRVAKYLDISPRNVNNLWAFDLILSSDHLPDRDLCALLTQRLQSQSLVEIAEFAFKYAGRKSLAITLLQFEPDARAQVKLLLALQSIDQAVQKALSSHQVDLVHTCFDLSAARVHDLVTSKSASLTGEELRLLLSLIQNRFYSEKRFQECCKVLQTIPGCEQLLADASLRLVWEELSNTSFFLQKKSLQLAEWMHYSAERFAECAVAPGGSLPNSPLGCQCTASLLAENAQLLTAQVQLEKTAAAKGWAKGPHRFAGLSLNATLTKLVLLGEIQEAESLRIKRKISDGRFWDLRVTAYLQNARLEEGITFASSRAPPSADCRGFKTVVEILLALKREDLALPFVKKLKPKKQAEIYSFLGLVDEARNAEQSSSAAGLFGRIASGLIGR